MKKLLALVLVLMMGLAAVASAQEDVRVDIGNQFSIARPESLEVVELTADDAVEGMVYAASNDELEMYVWLCETEDTKDELYDMFRQDDFLENVEVKAGGPIEYLEYRSEEEVGAVFMLEDGQYYEVVFYCVTDDAMAQAEAALSSLGLL